MSTSFGQGRVQAAILSLGTGSGSTTVIAKNHERRSARNAERAVLDLLPDDVSPSLLNASNEVLIIEDLGDGDSLADVLLQGDARAATYALQQWARSLGKIAAVTSKLPNSSHIPAMSLEIEPSQLRLVADAWKVPICSEMWKEIEDAFALSTKPALASSQSVAVGDAACADNNRIIDGRVKLFDFEWSGWANTAIDASYCLAPFSTCWCVAALPRNVQEAAYDAYCEEFPHGRSERFCREV